MNDHVAILRWIALRVQAGEDIDSSESLCLWQAADALERVLQDAQAQTDEQLARGLKLFGWSAENIQELKLLISWARAAGITEDRLPQYRRVLETEIALKTLEDAPLKLRMLADWFDLKDEPGESGEVQRDLRQWAQVIEAATGVERTLTFSEAYRLLGEVDS
jgi:hypothetical protein